jgi:hypothetical protein
LGWPRDDAFADARRGARRADAPGGGAGRGTITYDGTTMTFTRDAAADHLSVGPSQGELPWSTSGLDAIPP